MPNEDGMPIQMSIQKKLEDPVEMASIELQQDFDIPHVRRIIAGNPHTPTPVLIRLATDIMPTIRSRVAENVKTPSDVLAFLANDAHSEVRLAVAENQNTPPEVLSILACDEDADVRFGVAENPHMPETILVKLTEDDNPYIRCRALKTLQMLDPKTKQRIQLIIENIHHKQD